MQTVASWFACALLCLISSPSLQCQPQGDSGSSASALKTEPPTYPTFEPFLASRMFKVMVGDPQTLDAKKVLKQLTQMADIGRTAKEAGEQLAPKPAKDAPSALLEPKLSGEVRAWYPLLPALMIRLAPLWEASTWTEAQLDSAVEIAELLTHYPDGVSLKFTKDEPSGNHAQMEKLVRWFREQVARPERYAAMIATMDDGPYSGLPYAAGTLLPAKASVKLDEKNELHLCKVDRPKEPWILQGVREGKLRWSRVISAAPDESVQEVEFRESEARRLGDYGWKAFLQVNWSGGVEAGYVYLDAQGDLLFYFLSW